MNDSYEKRPRKLINKYIYITVLSGCIAFLLEANPKSSEVSATNIYGVCLKLNSYMLLIIIIMIYPRCAMLYHLWYNCPG